MCNFLKYTSRVVLISIDYVMNKTLCILYELSIKRDYVSIQWARLLVRSNTNVLYDLQENYNTFILSTINLKL